MSETLLSLLLSFSFSLSLSLSLALALSLYLFLSLSHYLTYQTNNCLVVDADAVLDHSQLNQNEQSTIDSYSNFV